MADILFLPVCSFCDAVQWGEEVNVEATSPLGIPQRTLRYYPSPPHFVITPNCCVRCGAVFDKIQTPAEFPFECPSGPTHSGLEERKTGR